ncbi:Structural maintenance of chromosomes protein 6, partial [Zancudomyces culisetae]
IQALSKTVKDIESAQTEPLEHIAAQTQHHIDAYARAKQTIRQMLNVSRILKDAHLIRLSRLSELKNAITKRVMFQFSLNLYRRGYGGLLHIDHQRQLLTPKVHTDADLALLSSSNANTNGISNPSSTSTPSSTNNSASTSNTSTLVNTRKDTRSLSGGEKSFTTISLLLALWDSTSCPIRALDEFDVFMDAANRSASMKMIVDSARCSPDSQYILITPQDLWVKPAADIKILVLDPPSR